MATYRAEVVWSLAEGEDFPRGRYSRGHRIRFGSGVEAPGTASAQVVGARWAERDALDPEEMLVAAISACHMLSFLHVARDAGFVVTRYADDAEGLMQPNAEGRTAVTNVTLRPVIAYEGEAPDAAARDRLHHAAHETCFIANSVRTEITVGSARGCGVSEPPVLATIGYEAATQADVIDRLKRAGVEVLIDVRAIAASRRAGFSKTLLAASLADAGIDYAHLRDLGTPKAGREAARKGRIGEMRQIFCACLEEPAAQIALEKAIGIARERRAALLCYEADAGGCHRAIVAERMQESVGFKVENL